MAEKKFILLVFIPISIVIALAFYLSTFTQLTGRFIQPQLSNDEIINKVKSFPEISQYSSLPTMVKFISLDELNSLVKKYPVIYRNISKAVYEVRFSSGNSGLLVLYDADSDKILKTFEIVGVSIS